MMWEDRFAGTDGWGDPRTLAASQSTEDGEPAPSSSVDYPPGQEPF